ncbi:MAG TPA: 3-isopropylmalate dehydratase small subunit [Chloroflexota bacterium]|nr:3-isopropylmalate dehydratase small subunit [Chloroflexota bacterium]
MKPFITHTGAVVPLDRVNVDTDQIIPKQFLKRVERTGFGEFLFYDWRRLPDGSPDPDFELNQPGYQGATILVAGRNFGCGSSREHAPWALLDYGFRAIVAPTYADIFYNNCFKNGILPVVLPEETVEKILERAKASPGYRLTVNLERTVVEDDQGLSVGFEIDEFRRHCLLNGLDDIGLSLRHIAAINSFEALRPSWKPVATGIGSMVKVS